MQFELPFRPAAAREDEPESLWVVGRPVPLVLVKNARARRYILRLCPDGSARVTIPRGGSAKEARRFAEKSVGWLERQRLRQAQQPTAPRAWTAGTEVLFRGLPVKLEPAPADGGGVLRLGPEEMRVREPGGDLRPQVEEFLWQLARRELPRRVFELASVHQAPVRRVLVRNQRSRWGSCSRHGTISLNWRLVQTPIPIRDYIICHELAHFKEMNHSVRFWREVARICPDFAQAERWLRKNARLLREP